MAITEPIFVYDPADLLVFETIWKAERYVEWADADDNIYFDAEGQILKSSVEKNSRGVEQTRIRESNAPQYDKARLRQIIVDALEYVNYPGQELDNKSFSELTAEILKFKTE